VYAPPKALDAVLRLDRPGMLDDSYRLNEFEIGANLRIGPFGAETRLLPHSLPNAGIRLEAPDGTVIAYTGDGGPSPAVIELARGADVLLAEASYADELPDDDRGLLSSARQAGEQAAAAGVQQLVLTHLLPGVDAGQALAAARHSQRNVVAAQPGLRIR
jgi:ribonuclease BN (tRNA processing enzyme)